MYPKLIYMEGILLDQADILAGQDRRFFSQGRPSSSAVIRKATSLFFSLPVRLRERLIDTTDKMEVEFVKDVCEMLLDGSCEKNQPAL